MAGVFISYARDDTNLARPLATALGRAGHSVWWDLHVRGGAQFSKVIEEALKAADVVVVLWSASSVESAWVRDEAAAGRDTGRLVPLTIDGTEPPLGFRQFHTIDFSGWNGRIRSDRFEALLDAVGSASGSAGKALPPAKRPQRKRRLNARLIFGLAAILLVLVVGLLIWRAWEAETSIPTVTVVPGDGAANSRGIASNLLVQLGSLKHADGDALQLIEPNSEESADFTFKVDSGDTAGEPRASVALVHKRDNILLWSREFEQPGGNQADLRQQIAYSAAQVLDCAVEGLSAGKNSIKLPTLKVYLSGCADMSNLLAQDPQVAASIFAAVTEEAPRFKGGWKKLLLADIQALRLSFGRDQRLRRKLKTHLTQARRLDPAMAEAFLAEAQLVVPNINSSWMKLVDQAVAADPNNPEILNYQSTALTNVGLMHEALASARRAVKSNPLSPSAREALITALLNSDQIEAARNELQKSEQLWPGATSVLDSRFVIEGRVGDASRALELLQSGKLGARYISPTAAANAAHESYFRAKIAPTAQNKELAVHNARALYKQDPAASWVYARALSEFDRHEELVDFLLKGDTRVPVGLSWTIFRPSFSALHNDPRFIVIAHRFGVSNFWRDTGRWPDFCARPDLSYDCKAEAAKLTAPTG